MLFELIHQVINKAHMTRYFDDLLLGSIELFCLAAEKGSFSAAANQAGITPAAVSRSVARLEKRLGIRLFTRTTRQMRLTDAGRRYFEQCQQALSQLVEAERHATGEQITPSGLLRISVPTPYAHSRLLPILPAFRQQYPDIELDIHISTRNIDFVEDQYDLVIRGRDPKDSTLIARKLEDAELVVVASPQYLHQAGIPQSLDDLPAHHCIQFELPSSGRKTPWLFNIAGKPQEMTTLGGYTCKEDYLGIVTLARAGAGIAQSYRFSVQKELASGELVELLPQHGGCCRPFILLYPQNRHLPQRVRAFIDFVVQQIGQVHKKRA